MRIVRIAAVTAGLAVAGGVFGTLAGLVMLIAWGLLDGGLMDFTRGDASVLLQLSVAFGGTPGAVLGPLAAWVLMRHVPLWLAVGGTTLGALASGGMGLLASGDPLAAMLYGMAGFGLTSIGLCTAVPRDPRRLPAGG